MSRAADLVCRTLTFPPNFGHDIEPLGARPDDAPGLLLVAATIALLSRYAGSDEVALLLSVPEGTRQLVTIRLEGDPDSRELLRRVASALARAPASAGGRVDHLVPGAEAAVEVCVALAAPESFAAAELTLNLRERAVELVFRAEHFEALAIERITAHLSALLVGLIETAGPLSAIPLVNGEERAWVLERSNAAAVDLNEILPSVVQCIERQAALAPEQLALIDGSRTLTYRELDAAASTLCARLRAHGVGSGVNVATHLERGADAVIALLAILKARGTYVPLDTSYPVGRLTAILARAAPRVVVTRASDEAAVGALFSSGAPPISLLIDRAQGDAPGARVVVGASPAEPDDVAYVLFTSGSTGQPKGVVVDHRSLSNYVRAAFDAYGVRAGDRVLQAASLGFDLSLEEIVITLTAGATLVIRSAPPIESVQSFFEECVALGLTVLSITSALWHELTLRLADGTVVLPPLLRLVILGADAARPDVLAQWQRTVGGRVRLVNTYGLTETTIVATTWEAGADALGDDWRALPIGRPLRNVSAYVLDSHDHLTPVGVAGQICIGGLAVVREYLDDSALSSARFAPDPHLAGGRMYRSGDRGVLRSASRIPRPR